MLIRKKDFHNFEGKWFYLFDEKLKFELLLLFKKVKGVTFTNTYYCYSIHLNEEHFEASISCRELEWKYVLEEFENILREAKPEELVFVRSKMDSIINKFFLGQLNPKDDCWISLSGKLKA